jgi:hypothetical protein
LAAATKASATAPPPAASSRASKSSGRSRRAFDGPSAAHRELAGAAHGTGEQEVREVRAGDRQHQPGEAEDHSQDCRCVVRQHGLVDLQRAPARSLVKARMFAGQPLPDRRDEALGVGLVDAIAPPADEPQPQRRAIGGLRLTQPERAVEIVGSEVAPVADLGRQHPDHGVRLAVGAQRPPDHRRVAAEAALPDAMAQDEHAVVAVRHLVGAETAAERGLDAERREQPTAHPQPAHRLGGLPGSREAHADDAVARDVAPAASVARHRERPLEVEPVGSGEGAARVVAGRAVDAVELRALRVRQRPQKDRVDDRKGRCAGADAQPQRDDGDGGEAGRAAQRAQREAHVAAEGEEGDHEHGLCPFWKTEVHPTRVQTASQCRYESHLVSLPSFTGLRLIPPSGSTVRRRRPRPEIGTSWRRSARPVQPPASPDLTPFRCYG